MGGSLAEARDGVEVALAEAHLALVGPPLARQPAVHGAQAPAARLRAGPRAAHAAHPGNIAEVKNIHSDCKPAT